MPRPRAPLLALLLLPGALLLPGCGGSGGGSSPAVPSAFHTASAVNALTGFGQAGAVIGTSQPLAGDTVPATNFRGFVRFDTSGLPPGAVIVTATLRLHQTTVDGDPYGKFGPLHVDHVDFLGSLDGGDFAGGTLAADVGVLATTATLGYRSLDVTSRVAADRAAGRTTSDFRLAFGGALGGDAVTDMAYFGSLVVPGEEPQLVIGYD